MLPGHFTDVELFEAIARISYLGDPRFALGAENKNKVRNIVSGSLDAFREMYADILCSVPWIVPEEAKTDGESGEGMRYYARRLPRDDMLDEMASSANSGALLPEKLRRIFAAKPHDGNSSKECKRPDAADVAEGIGAVVRAPAAAQTLKGAFTSGIARSARYAAAKLAKGRE